MDRLSQLRHLCEIAAKLVRERHVRKVPGHHGVEIRTNENGEPYIVILVDFDPPLAAIPFASIKGFSVYREKRPV